MQSERRIRESMTASDPTKKISGDRGGKGEVLALLKNTLQPVLMTCTIYCCDSKQDVLEVKQG